MCTGLEIAAIAAAVGGTGAMAAGQANAKKSRAAASLQQTEMSAEEFNKRNDLANDIFKQNTTISRDTYDELNGLSDQEFQQRTGLSKDAFNQLSDIDREQVISDAASSATDTAAIRDARIARDTTRDQAKDEYGRTLADANTRQDEYRAKGDAVAQQLVQAFTPGAITKRQDDAVANRDALVASTISPPSATPPVPRSSNPAIAAAFDRYAANSRDKALANATAGSRVASYADMLGGGDRAIDTGALDTAFITDAAKRSLAPLGANLGVSSLKYNDAASSARDKATAADADLAAALGLSDTKAQGAVKGVTSYTGAMDSALSDYFANRSTSAAGKGNALIDANSTQLNGTNSVSQNYENDINNVTNFRMANADGGLLSTLGQFASSVAPTLFNIGQQKKFAKVTPAPSAG